ncbi:MAG: fused MFS/spermidine synthase [Chlamydiota bacterium]
MSVPVMARRGPHLLLYVCVLFSGFSGLVYEVVWAKYLSIAFGNTTYAYTVVLATFMGGLALGSFLLGRLADRIREKLVLYACAEIGIAFFCMLTPRIFALSRTLYLAAAGSYPPHSPVLTVVMCAIGASIMLLPTLLMGGTLPVLSAAMTTSYASRGKTIARIYYSNSCGAVLGTLACGYYLISHFGLGLTIVMAACLNLLVAAAVLGIRLCCGRPVLGQWSDDEGRGRGAEGRARGAYPGAFITVALCALFVSGMTAMLYELVWVRLLSLVLGSSTYSFSAMLAAFISGITLGSFLISRSAPEERAALWLFGVCEAGIGLFLIVSIPFYEKLPHLFLRLSDFLSRRPETFMLYEGAKLGVSLLVMLPPTVFLGMTVPLVCILASRTPGLFGGNVGTVFAFNTAGNILGALATGLVLIPVMGLQPTLELGIILNLGLGILLVCMDRGPSPRRKIGFCLACCAACVASATLIPEWNKTRFTSQVFRLKNPPDDFSPASVTGRKKVLYYKDGLNASVAVVESEGYRFLYVNGKADASTRGDMPTQVLLAALPLLLAPPAGEIMVIGLGAGVTGGTALLFPVKSLDMVELSSEVVEAAAYFAPENHHVLKDPRLRLFIEDARTFIRRTGRKYDLIISEPSNPWMSGVGDLFSIEHFRACLAALREDGVMAQWVHTYEMDDDTFKMIVKTYCSVFPNVTLWEVTGNNVLLLGTRHGLKPDFGESELRMALPPVREQLARFGVNDLFTLLCLQIGSDANIRGSVHSERAVNSEYAPLLEYRAARALYTDSFVKTYLEHLDERRFSPEKYDLLLKPYLRAHGISGDNLWNLFNFLKNERGGYNAYLSLPALDTLNRKTPGDRAALLAYLSSDLAPLQAQIREVEEHIRAGDRGFKLLELCAALRLKNYFMLRSFLEPELVPDTIEKLTQCARMTGDKKAKFYYLMGRVCLNDRDYGKAFSYYRESNELLKAEGGK